MLTVTKYKGLTRSINKITKSFLKGMPKSKFLATEVVRARQSNHNSYSICKAGSEIVMFQLKHKIIRLNDNPHQGRTDTLDHK